MKKLLSVLLVVVMIFGLVACGGDKKDDKDEAADESKEETEKVEEEKTEEEEEKEESEPAAEETDETDSTEELKVVYSIPGLSAPIWTVASQGFEAAAEEYGWQYELLDPNDNLETQISQIENAMTKKMDALIITPIDGEAVSALMGNLAEQRIPVVAIDRQVQGESLTTVEADNYKIGQALGEMYIEDLGDNNGKVLIVGGPLSSSATVNRTEGFKDAVSSVDNIEIVAESATEMDGEVVLGAVTNYLQANPDINCVMSCTDYILPSILTALDEAGKLYNIGEAEHVNIYSVDGDGYGLSRVVDGTIDATYSLDPYGWAYAAVEAIDAFFNEKSVEENILIGGDIVTQENFEELKNEGVLWGADSMD